jgi:lipoyl(octanoyl) transferase
MLEILHLPEPITYEDGLRLQEQHVDAILSGTGQDTIFLLEHEPVYTIGRLRDQSSLRDAGMLPHPVFETNRGGQATYHGPGQLVGYPILDLNRADAICMLISGILKRFSSAPAPSSA